MEPNQSVQSVEQPTQIPPMPPQPKSSKLSLILLSLVTLLSTAGLIYFYNQTQGLNKHISAQLSPIPSAALPSTKPLTSTNPTINWQVYTNNYQNFSIKIPASLTVSEETPTTTKFAEGNNANVIIISTSITEPQDFPGCDYDSRTPKLPCITTYHDERSQAKNNKIITQTKLGDIEAQRFNIVSTLTERHIVVQTLSNPKIEIQSLYSGEYNEVAEKFMDQVIPTFKLIESK